MAYLQRDGNYTHRIGFVVDFDGTLVRGNCQDALFRHYGINKNDFWDKVGRTIREHASNNIYVSKHTVYMSVLLDMYKGRELPRFNIGLQRSFGKQQQFFPGMPDFFRRKKEYVEELAKRVEQLSGRGKYHRHKLESTNGVISSGMRQIILGSDIAEYMQLVMACDFLYDNPSSLEGTPTGIARMLEHSNKPGELIAFSKGCYSANPEERVDIGEHVEGKNYWFPAANMIVLGDGLTDTDFMTVGRNIGAKAISVFDREKGEAVAKKLFEDGRVDSYQEADYSKGSKLDNYSNEKLEEIICAIITSIDQIES